MAEIINWENFRSTLQASIENIFHPARSDLLDWLYALANLELLLHGVLVFVLLLIGRRIYDLVTPFSLAEVLTTKDNKALAISFGSYLLSLAIVIAGVYHSDSAPLAEQTSYGYRLLYSLTDTFFWGAIAICFLPLAQVLNNHFILSQFHNYSEIVDNRNIAAGICEGASYIASGIILYGVMQGNNQHFLLDLLITVFYFLLGQLALIGYAKLFIALRSKTWDFHAQIVNKNPAAAIRFAFSLISFALLLSAYIANFDSIYGLLLVFILAPILLLLIYWLVDKLVFPKVSLRDEIIRDQNWGAALIAGFLTLGFSAILIVAFSSP